MAKLLLSDNRLKSTQSAEPFCRWKLRKQPFLERMRRGQNEAACAHCAVAATLILNWSFILVGRWKSGFGCFFCPRQVFWYCGVVDEVEDELIAKSKWMVAKQEINIQAFTTVTIVHVSMVIRWAQKSWTFFLQHICSNRKPKYLCFLLSSWFEYSALVTILSFFFFSLLPQMLGWPPLDAPYLAQLGRNEIQLDEN